MLIHPFTFDGWFGSFFGERFFGLQRNEVKRRGTPNFVENKNYQANNCRLFSRAGDGKSGSDVCEYNRKQHRSVIT